MRRLTLALAIMLATALWAPLSAHAEFGLKDLDVTFTDRNGTVLTQAGAHPYAMKVDLFANTVLDPKFGLEAPEGDLKDVFVTQIPGLAGNPTAVSRCSSVDFLAGGGEVKCAPSSAVGVATIHYIDPTFVEATAIYNLVPSPGKVAKLGFVVAGVRVTVDVEVSPTPPYNVIARSSSLANVVFVYGSELTLWGVPADPAHDPLRGKCVNLDGGSNGLCPARAEEEPFLTVPRACEGPLPTLFEAFSWQGDSFEETIFTHNDAGEPFGFTDCGRLGFAPEIAAQPTSKAASSPSGLDFSLEVEDEGLTSGKDGALAASDIRKAVVTLPEGMSANPSIAEGLEVCTEAQLEAETAFSAPGAGCPNASKIGSVEVETPLLEDTLLKGSLFISKPYENPFDSLLAMYLVIQDRDLGISVKQPLHVIPDPLTGQLTTVSEEMPQLPFSHFRLHFREGARSPLATPSACGDHTVKALLYPWAGGAPVTSTSTFQIISGPDGGPCPKGGLPPFKPGLVAGTINNRAGGFSPFNLRLHRTDAEQEITHFSIKLPPGIVGKLAGIPYCPDAAIAAAKARTGPLGGHEELADPSCPAASEVGRSLAGAGVGPALAYAPGKVYLAGPYNGSKMSIVAITAGVVGPFDIGTVVIRQALQINPETAEVFIDATGSDPIPHIIQGIPVHLRDIRAYVDKPDFVLNPTDCTRTSTASTALGSGLDFVSTADDNPITVTSPFQAADCAALPFKPNLSMKLVGGTKRGAHPAFKAHLQMNGIGEAGIAYAQVTLPRSEFIENAHFDTICTRVQFKAGAGNGAQCPPGSIYGTAKAVTPILSEPLTGPVFLRSSEHQLPDLVIALHNSQVDFNLIGRVDSVDGQIRNTFEAAPDAPVTSFDIALAGGKKGLFVNSTNLCKRKHRAKVGFIGQNGKVFNSRPVLKVKCKGKKAKGAKKAKRRGKRATLRHSRAAG